MNKLTYIAELSLMGCTKILCKQDELKKGRLIGKLERLEKLADKELDRHNISKSTEVRIKSAIVKFTEESGWQKKQLSIGTFISFILAVVDESENKFNDNILETISEIFDYFERKEQFRTLCYSAGAVACGKWNRIKGELLN